MTQKRGDNRPFFLILFRCVSGADKSFDVISFIGLRNGEFMTSHHREQQFGRIFERILKLAGQRGSELFVAVQKFGETRARNAQPPIRGEKVAALADHGKRWMHGSQIRERAPEWEPASIFGDCRHA